MYEGAPYVAAAYGFMAVMLGIWFAMIARRHQATRPTTTTTSADD